MDPSANIAEQCEIAAELLAICEQCDDDGRISDRDSGNVAEEAFRLAELVQALDEWRRKGGYDPYGA